MSQSYWTAASETHQRESNTFIIQLNNRSVKDRSFSDNQSSLGFANLF